MNISIAFVAVNVKKSSGVTPGVTSDALGRPLVRFTSSSAPHLAPEARLPIGGEHLDRIFRHFRARDIINATADQHKNVLLLDTTDGWIEPNFTDGTFKNNCPLLFFPVTNDTKSWSVVAATDADPFKDEDARAAKVRADKSAKAKARKTTAAKKAKKAKTAKKAKSAKKAKKASRKRRTPSKSKAKSKTAHKRSKKR
jgi:hypothetical protein